MPLLRKPRRGKGMTLANDSEELAAALDGFAARRSEFLRCSGMHTKPVQKVVEAICQGKVRGPGVGFVAPALYEGIPEFLDKTMDAMGELAVYASLYMGLIATAGMSGFYPAITVIADVNVYYNGVFASMFCHSGVVMMAVTYRLAAVGHMRDSDKLLYLWRARYVPLINYAFFATATASVMVTLMASVRSAIRDGGACFASIGDPTMHWDDWWDEWVGYESQLKQGIRIPVGAGVVHPQGEEVLNPWILKANELGITRNSSFAKDGYHEFMRDHFGFSKSCEVQTALHERYGGYHGGNTIFAFWMLPYMIIGLCLPWMWILLWIAPTRHIFNYWLQPNDKCKRYSLGTLGYFSFYTFGPLAYDKIDDPYDLTEAWAEFQYRASIGAKLAEKDMDRSGAVDVTEHREVSSAELEDTSLENLEAPPSYAESQLDAKTSQVGSLPTAVVVQLIATQQKTNELLEKLVRLDHGKTASSVRSRKKTPAGTELVDDRDAAPVGMAYSV